MSLDLVYVQVDEVVTFPEVVEYAQMWGGELHDSPRQLSPGCWRLRFAEDKGTQRFVSSPQYIHDKPVLVRTEPVCPDSGCTAAERRVARHLPLDGFFWTACGVILELSIEEARCHPAFHQIQELSDQHELALAPFSLAHTEVWGPVSHAELLLEFPDGVSYSPDEDRIYFNDLDVLFHGLQRWYQAGDAVIAHPWIHQRRRDFDLLMNKILSFIEADDVFERFASMALKNFNKS